jgi:O-methyltransferase involved in polyketide biosynthesis
MCVDCQILLRHLRISMRGFVWLTFLGALLGIFIFQFIFGFEESSISPTAHYTSYIWVKHELSPSQFITPTGILLFFILEPLMMISRLVNGPTVENMLVARHKMIDLKLEELIEKGQVTQIIEIASGLSGRGTRFVKKYGNNITYFETDFVKMVSLKQKLLAEQAIPIPTNHKFIPLNALKSSGPDTLESLFHHHIQSYRGVVVVTEGLLPYFTQQETHRFWSLLSKELSVVAFGVYISDLYLKEDIRNDFFSQTFLNLLSLFVQKKVTSYELSRRDVVDSFAQLEGPTQILVLPSSRYSDRFPEVMKAKGAEKVRLLDVRYQQSLLN